MRETTSGNYQQKLRVTLLLINWLERHTDFPLSGPHSYYWVNHGDVHLQVNISSETSNGNYLNWSTNPGYKRIGFGCLKSPRTWCPVVLGTFFYGSWEAKNRDRRIWWTKFASRVHAIGRNLVRRNHAGSAKCPCCGEEESPDHLLRCTHEEITNAFHRHINRLYGKLRGSVDETLIEGIKAILLGFRTGRIVYHPGWNDQYFRFLVTQFRLGQGPFQAGLWLCRWQNYHEEFASISRIRRRTGVA